MRSRFWTVALLGILAVVPANADITIKLKKSFIAKYKHRATIETPLTPRKASPHVKAPSEDGDVHIASTASDEIGLALVAEICNAKLQKPAYERVKSAIAQSETIPVTGVWRLWCEHGGDNTFAQGGTFPTPSNTNPDHVFEIHPLTVVDGIDVKSSFQPIQGYQYKDAEQAFQRYETVKCHLTPGSNTVTITTVMAGFNYVEFVIKLQGPPPDPPAGADSTFVYSNVYDLGGDKIVGGQAESATSHRGQRRMVFVKGTPPDDLLHTLADGAVLRVIGVPRIDLALVEWRSNHSSIPGVLDWNLPYEMVILAASTENVPSID